MANVALTTSHLVVKRKFVRQPMILQQNGPNFFTIDLIDLVYSANGGITDSDVADGLWWNVIL